MLDAFRLHIKDKFPELLRRRFLLACSGGIDSMVLTELCACSKMNFALAHCNFQLRGGESDADAEFLEKRAAQLGVQIFITTFKTKKYAQEHKVSIQMAARELRYAWFDQIMQENGIKTLVTAHHADDNLETFLINISRGTGIAGLTGIPKKTDTLSRPLLAFSRTQIEDYAQAKNIEWREDGSNANTKYLRNDIRHGIVPLLKDLNPNFLDNFLETQAFLTQTADVANNHIRDLKSRVFQPEGDVTRIPVAEIIGLKPLQGYLYGLFGEYGFTEWGDVENLLHATSGKQVRSRTHRLVKDRDCLLLTKVSDNSNTIPSATGRMETEEEFLIEKGQRSIEYPLKIDISEVETIDETAPHILYVPQKALKYPLTFRKWRKGDYFYPFGMQGKKKLSKFFKDEKVDVLAKERQWLLCSDGEILWVVGRRADERFRVLESTEQVLKMELK